MLEAPLVCLVTNGDVFSRTRAKWDIKPGKYTPYYSLYASYAATPLTAVTIQIILFSSNGYSASSQPVILKTDSSVNADKKHILTSNLRANLEVDHITNHSALLIWTFPVTHSIHGLKFKVNCTGSQAYLMNGRAIHEIYHTKSYIHDALSKYNQEQLIEDLVPNVNYTCQVASSVADNELVSIVHFKTLVGRPQVPKRPKVSISHDVEIILHPTSNQFGLISHYTLLAVPVHKDKSQPITEPFSPLIPYNKLLNKAKSSQVATHTRKSVAFVIDTYSEKQLPSKLILENTTGLLSAFKPNQYYSLVLAVFTKTKEKSLLYSLSPPSDPPFTLNNSMYMYASWHAKETTVGQVSKLVLWAIGLVAFCAVTVTITCIGTVYLLQNRGYKIPFKWNDSSDSENDELLDNTKEKTYVPMKPIIDLHTEETTMVTVEADATNYDNPHFSTSMHHSKDLLEDLQDTMDCTSATVNPPQSPFEISQSPSVCFDKAEEVSPIKPVKKGPPSPFYYSTPGELEKLQTGTYSLPRSVGPIKTPRRKAAPLRRQPGQNKGIPIPAPCKPSALKESTSQDTVLT
ncbi:uncharacterized protein [Dysidea avara]|uniref:uncharacterized protein isoform X3 n=1 Tax=Dysidea avara TaxID=196820 RepID=UPI00332BACFF